MPLVSHTMSSPRLRQVGSGNKLFLAGVGLLAALAFGLPSTPAAAATATATMGVSATVQATCSITTTPLAFPTYTGAQDDSTGSLSVTVTCTDTTPYTIGLDAGLGTGATVTTRTMTVGGVGATLNYALFQDAGRSIPWGNTPGTDTSASATGTGAAQLVTVYGRIPAGQLIAPGAYTDTITATVYY